MQTQSCRPVEKLSRAAVQSAPEVSPAAQPYTRCKQSKLAGCHSCLSMSPGAVQPCLLQANMLQDLWSLPRGSFAQVQASCTPWL